ncbi:myeloid-associated differentiation marker [Parambassis ranga]|uniref:Myeloid-associated differentiation marker n=1 Tax=Parambassis ranga TaxID=210632 RepID=A0A6P7IX51_9TELE|nr:myeloid-associated differentiation marker-like [Parambassis ranga]
MVTVDVRTLVVRILEVVFTVVTFSLVASVGHSTYSLWTWCMFTWCFCFCVTLLVLILELTGLGAKLPISWDDFKTAFAMLATLMVLSASIIYGVLFTCKTCSQPIAATVTSILAFVLYAIEVGLIRAKPGEISGFLSSVPGLLKVLEAFVACIIFICLNQNHYSHFPGLQWCVAVYAICFIFALLVIIFTIGRLLGLIPVFDKVLTGCNILAVLMYITAAVIWPYYSFHNNPRPNFCSTFLNCNWNLTLVIAFMTFVNLIAYIVDTVYSFRLVFFVTRT